MISPDTLDALIARLEKAEDGDRELSCSIAKAVGWRPEDGAPGSTTSSPWAWCPDFTSSIDAALGLVERVLPGWMVVNLCEWDSDILRSRGPWTCTLKKLGTQDDFTADKGQCPHAPTPALAVCLATLRALKHREQGNG